MIRVTSAGYQQYCHTDSGWSTGAIGKNHLAIFGEGQRVSSVRVSESGPNSGGDLARNVGYGGQVVRGGYRDEMLRVNHLGEVIDVSDEILCSFPKNGRGPFRLLHSAQARMPRYIWASQRNWEDGTNDWFAGYFDLETGRRDWRHSDDWLPFRVGSLSGWWHEFHCDGQYGLVLGKRDDAQRKSYREAWHIWDAPTGDLLEVAPRDWDHLAVNGKHAIYNRWNRSSSPWSQESVIMQNFVEADVIPTPGDPFELVYNHYYIMEWFGRVYWVGSLYTQASAAQELVSIDVYGPEGLIKSFPATRQLWGDSQNGFLNHARPFLWDRENSLWAVWHSDERQVGATDVYAAKVLDAPQEQNSFEFSGTFPLSH